MSAPVKRSTAVYYGVGPALGNGRARRAPTVILIPFQALLGSFRLQYLQVQTRFVSRLCPRFSQHLVQIWSCFSPVLAQLQPQVWPRFSQLFAQFQSISSPFQASFSSGLVQIQTYFNPVLVHFQPSFSPGLFQFQTYLSPDLLHFQSSFRPILIQF